MYFKWPKLFCVMVVQRFSEVIIILCKLTYSHRQNDNDKKALLNTVQCSFEANYKSESVLYHNGSRCIIFHTLRDLLGLAEGALRSRGPSFYIPSSFSFSWKTLYFGTQITFHYKPLLNQIGCKKQHPFSTMYFILSSDTNLVYSFSLKPLVVLCAKVFEEVLLWDSFYASSFLVEELR